VLQWELGPFWISSAEVEFILLVVFFLTTKWQMPLGQFLVFVFVFFEEFKKIEGTRIDTIFCSLGLD
jgi:hypothetical protein